VLVRVTNVTSGDTLERRYMATLDRSNVFLPEAAVRNGSYRDPATGQPFASPLTPAQYADDSGEMLRFGFDAAGNQLYGPGPGGLDDPDHFDRLYTRPKVVAFQRVPDPR
ncbi:MAG: hypothetical protein HRF43_10270, partial [Phycisphaerae bacterium]